MRCGRNSDQKRFSKVIGDAACRRRSAVWRRPYDAAFYLAGYAVECALKACIASKVKRFEFPPKPDLVRRMYTHDLLDLVKLANLTSELESERKRDSQMDIYWRVALNWNEQARYNRLRTESRADAQKLILAIADPGHGVLQWLKRFW